MANSKKKLQDLGLADNFLFGAVMSEQHLCKLFLEALLEKKIAKIINISKEKDLADAYASHGIRLDVYLEDENHTRYNVEMQGETQKELERRIRYYQGGIDRNFLKSGLGYENLPNSYVIFLCNYDQYGAGLPVYEREAWLRGTDIPYEDGSHAIILNAKYKVPGDANRDILEFLDFVRTNDGTRPVSGELAKEAIRLCNEKRADARLEEQYMTFQMLIHDLERDAAAKSKMDLLIKLFLKGTLSADEAAMEANEDCGVTKEQFSQAVEVYKQEHS